MTEAEGDRASARTEGSVMVERAEFDADGEEDEDVEVEVDVEFDL